MRKISWTFFLSSSVVAFLAMASLLAPVLAQEVECATPVIVVDSAPPPLPDYDQPPVPGPDWSGRRGSGPRVTTQTILLGAGDVGSAAARGLVVDAGLLGLGGRQLSLPPRLLG